MADKTLKEYVDIIAEKNLFNKVGSSTTPVETLKFKKASGFCVVNITESLNNFIIYFFILQYLE